MSSRKDKFSPDDKKFMKLALNLAINNKSLTENLSFFVDI